MIERPVPVNPLKEWVFAPPIKELGTGRTDHRGGTIISGCHCLPCYTAIATRLIYASEGVE